MKKPTMKDIASELNITVGAVSHAFNNRRDISDEMRKKIFETAARIGYIANGSAVSLRLGNTHTIAIIIPDISNPHIANQVKLIQENMELNGYSTIILNTQEDDNKEYKAIITSCEKNVDGIFICPAQHNSNNLKLLQEFDIPFVLIGRFFSEFDTDYVCADDVKAGFLAASYLLARNYSHTVYVGANDYIQPSLNRLNGIRSAYENNNITFNENYIYRINPISGNAEKVLKKIKDDNIAFDSVIAFSDLLAFEIQTGLNSLYPNTEIPIVGFDGLHSNLHLPFHHISIKMKGNGWADSCTDILFEKMTHKIEKPDTKHCLVDVELQEF